MTTTKTAKRPRGRNWGESYEPGERVELRLQRADLERLDELRRGTGETRAAVLRRALLELLARV
jgi:hypothetical protein